MLTRIKDYLAHIKSIKRRYLVIGSAMILLLAVVFVIFNWPYHEYEEIGMRPEWSVADNIVKSPDSQIFASAVYNLGYTTFLQGEGPYTVFIPTDASYERLSPEMKYFLNDTGNQGSIRQVVLYHVVPGLYRFSDLKDGMVLTTVQGEELRVTHSGGQVILNGISFIETYDIMAKNGVLHTVNGYLLPPSIDNLQ